MDDKQLLYLIKEQKKFKDKELLLLSRRRERRSTNIIFSLYFGTVIFIIGLSFKVFALAIYNHITILNMNRFMSSSIIAMYRFMSYFISYIFGVLILLIGLNLLNYIMNKNYKKEKEVVEKFKKLKNGNRH